LLVAGRFVTLKKREIFGKIRKPIKFGYKSAVESSVLEKYWL